MRVRPGGSHHQKFVVLRHPGRPELDVAFVGGIDLCHGRLDGPEHAGDPQGQPMAQVYGSRPPWHDVQLAVRGPAVADVETAFRERWDDPAPLTRNPFDRLPNLLRREDQPRGVLPAPLPDPQPRGTNTYSHCGPIPSVGDSPFAPDGERSVAHAYDKVIARAHSLIYLEDQYFWARDVVRCFAAAESRRAQQALDDIRAAGGDRAGVYGIENRAGTPICVHAKVCIVDDVWASVGSDNVNRRSWTHDSELSCAVIDDAVDEREPRILDRFGDGARVFARELRLHLALEHLERDAADDADLLDPISAFAAFSDRARRLQLWHDHSKTEPRPPGRLRPYATGRLTRRTLAGATPLYRIVADPDARPRPLRRAGQF